MLAAMSWNSSPAPHAHTPFIGLSQGTPTNTTTITHRPPPCRRHRRRCRRQGGGRCVIVVVLVGVPCDRPMNGVCACGAGEEFQDMAASMAKGGYSGAV